MAAVGLRHSKEITFFDHDGMRWTVVPLAAGRVLGAGPAAFEFFSEAGERRVASGHVPTRRGLAGRRRTLVACGASGRAAGDVGSPQSREGDERKEKKLDLILRAIDPDNADKEIEKLDRDYARR